jgi:hypothetical protein
MSWTIKRSGSGKPLLPVRFIWALNDLVRKINILAFNYGICLVHFNYEFFFGTLRFYSIRIAQQGISSLGNRRFSRQTRDNMHSQWSERLSRTFRLFTCVSVSKEECRLTTKHRRRRFTPLALIFDDDGRILGSSKVKTFISNAWDLVGYNCLESESDEGGVSG